MLLHTLDYDVHFYFRNIVCNQILTLYCNMRKSGVIPVIRTCPLTAHYVIVLKANMSPLLAALHCLPVKSRIAFKTLLLTYSLK